MVWHIVIFVISLGFLAKGADYFVEYSARIAKRLGVSDFIIGLTITSLGTSIPELAAGVTASINHYSDLVVGNLVGSNIANIGLILGFSAAYRAFKTQRKMYDRDGYILMASVLLFFAFSLDNRLSGGEAFLLLALYFIYLFFLIRSDIQRRSYQFHDFMAYVFNFEYISPFKTGLYRIAQRKAPEQRTRGETDLLKLFKKDVLKDVIVIVLGLLALMIGAKYLVEEAVWIARYLGMPESLIGMSMVAIGTSIPELTVSFSAVRKGKGGIVVGHILGSNIANLLLIGGLAGLIYPMEISEISVTYMIPIMLFFSLALVYFIKSNWEIGRWKGRLAIIAYVAFLVMAFVMGMG